MNEISKQLLEQLAKQKEGSKVKGDHKAEAYEAMEEFNMIENFLKTLADVQSNAAD